MTYEEAKAQLTQNNSKGWIPLLTEVFEKLPAHLTIISAHNKWGGLNFDLVPRDDEFEDFLFDIDERSRKICEICGENGFFAILDSWETTVCTAHYEAFPGKKYKAE